MLTTTTKKIKYANLHLSWQKNKKDKQNKKSE